MKENEKFQKFIIISIVCVAILIISLAAFLNNNSQNSKSNISMEQNDSSASESASTKIGKTTEESQKDLQSNQNTIDFEQAEVIRTPSNKQSTQKSSEDSNSKSNPQNQPAKSTAEENEKSEIAETSSNQTSNEEPTFEAPVKGTILRNFAKDSLVYSETLKEWITHNGIDIKADKTTVVSSSAPGTVYAIKNDPRYGLTVIINHNNGYQTIYSNLLTSEFVVEGEKIEQGQSIGTVGNTASFEVLDDYHLHFELLKDGEHLDPTIYINFE